MKPAAAYPDATAVMPMQFYGSVQYYAAMAAFGRVVIDTAQRHDKRMKSLHRCEIADVRGRMALTVPVQKPGPGFDHTWRTIRVSDHNRWWEDMVVALESAYGRTPYFEFYRHRLMGWMGPQAVGRSVADVDAELDGAVRAILGLDHVSYMPLSEERGEKEQPLVDLRRTPWEQALDIEVMPYYQVRASKLGFIPGLSILDLIFNMGPEAEVAIRTAKVALV